MPTTDVATLCSGNLPANTHIKHNTMVCSMQRTGRLMSRDITHGPSGSTFSTENMETKWTNRYDEPTYYG